MNETQFDEKKPVGRPPKPQFIEESMTRAAWLRECCRLMNERDAEGYEKDAVYDTGGGDVKIVWRRKDPGNGMKKQWR